MQLNVPSDAMQALVAKALFETMTQEQRDGLVQKAISDLLRVPDGVNKKSTIQALFNEQVDIAARNIARERLATDETFKAQIERIFADAVAKCFADGQRRDEIVDGLASAMRKVITGDRY